MRNATLPPCGVWEPRSCPEPQIVACKCHPPSRWVVIRSIPCKMELLELPTSQLVLQKMADSLQGAPESSCLTISSCALSQTPGCHVCELQSPRLLRHVKPMMSEGVRKVQLCQPRELNASCVTLLRIPHLSPQISTWRHCASCKVDRTNVKPCKYRQFSRCNTLW